MKKQCYSWLMLAIFISISFVACKDKGKGEEKETTTDTSSATTDNNTAGMDAVTAGPDLYKVVADTLGIRLVEVLYKPGDSSVMHWHPDYAVYAIEGGEATFYTKEGTRIDNKMEAGMTMVRPGESHSVKNNGKTNIHVMLVEVNRSGAVTTPDAGSDAVKVAPDVYKIKNDTMGIRVLEITSNPGASVAMHAHPDGAIYFINGGTSEFTSKDGTKRVAELKAGMGMVLPADMHSVKNTGKTTLKAILVEVNRAIK